MQSANTDRIRGSDVPASSACSSGPSDERIPQRYCRHISDPLNYFLYFFRLQPSPCCCNINLLLPLQRVAVRKRVEVSQSCLIMPVSEGPPFAMRDLLSCLSKMRDDRYRQSRVHARPVWRDEFVRLRFAAGKFDRYREKYSIETTGIERCYCIPIRWYGMVLRSVLGAYLAALNIHTAQ